MHSGRAEAFGVLAALIFLRHYIESYGPHLFSASTIQCYCNNSGVITTTNDLYATMITRPNDTTNDDHDVYLAINETISQCAPVTLRFIHVKGHQDSKSKKPLTLIEQFNVDCDRRAKQYVTQSTISSTSFGNPAIPAAQPHLRIGGKLICRKLIPTLRQTMSMPEYHRYLLQKYSWKQSDAALLHWRVFQHALETFLKKTSVYSPIT